MNFMEEIFEIRSCIEILFLNVNPIPSTKYFKPWHSNVAQVSGSSLDTNRITAITVLAYLVLHYRKSQIHEQSKPMNTQQYIKRTDKA